MLLLLHNSYDPHTWLLLLLLLLRDLYDQFILLLLLHYAYDPPTWLLPLCDPYDVHTLLLLLLLRKLCDPLTWLLLLLAQVHLLDPQAGDVESLGRFLTCDALHSPSAGVVGSLAAAGSPAVPPPSSGLNGIGARVALH